MVFPFSVFCGLNFYARLLPIQTIDDTKNKSGNDSQANAARHKGYRGTASDDKSCDRNLVWCNSRFAKERDYRSFDWRVNVSRQVERSILGGIENDPLS